MYACCIRLISETHYAQKEQIKPQNVKRYDPVQDPTIPREERQKMADERVRKLPFFIARSNHDGLPVYRHYRYGKTQTVTVLRKYDGNVEELKKQWSELLEDRAVTEKVGRLEVKGDHAHATRKWLRILGF